MNKKTIAAEPQFCEPKPFLKWAGGKRQLLEELLAYSPKAFKSYFEPFVGGGALFFKLSATGRIRKAYLNDTNEVLTNAYQIIKEKPEELIEELRSGGYENDKDTFLYIRAQQPTDLIKATARLLYLNKTAFNGLYRVNSKGKFNVPFGRYTNPTILNEKNIRAASKALHEALLTDEITSVDFEVAVDKAEDRDFVYFDPPYHPLSKTSSFTSYTKESFSEKDQTRLANKFKELADKGCYVMLSNSYSEIILDLYKDFNIHMVTANRMINCKAEGRGKIKEVIITNYPVRKSNVPCK